MKKNLLTVLILALALVNVILSAVMMFSVMSTNRKTAALANQVLAILSLELEQPEEEEEKVSMADLSFWTLSDKMTIPLVSDDGKSHYIVFEVAFSMDTTTKGYKKYGADVEAGTYESIIKDVINNTVSKYTLAECNADFDVIKAEILKSVQDLFDEDFIYSVAISGIQTQ